MLAKNNTRPQPEDGLRYNVSQPLWLRLRCGFLRVRLEERNRILAPPASTLASSAGCGLLLRLGHDFPLHTTRDLVN